MKTINEARELTKEITILISGLSTEEKLRVKDVLSGAVIVSESRKERRTGSGRKSKGIKLTKLQGNWG